MKFLLIINVDTEETEERGMKEDRTEWEDEYVITSLCYGCRKCVLVCPAECISGSSFPFYIDQDRCVHCGTCAEVCPVSAVRLI